MFFSDSHPNFVKKNGVDGRLHFFIIFFIIFLAALNNRAVLENTFYTSN